MTMSSIVWFFKFTIGFAQIKIGTPLISHYGKITSLNFNNRVCGPMIFAIFAALSVKKQKLNPYSFLETVI